jgi:DNA-binding NarL/FixJ family response regulator
VRASTRRILEREDDLEVVGEAADGQEAVTLTGRLHPDVAIVDIAMPEVDGIEVARRIKGISPDTAVLMLTVLNDPAFISSSLEVGVAGYLLKSVRSHDLVQAVREACGSVPSPSDSVLWRVLDFA